MCQRAGCMKPTFDGLPGFCSTACRDGRGAAQPMAASQNGIAFGDLLLRGHQKFDDLANQFTATWQDATTACPAISRIYCVKNSVREKGHSTYCATIGNVKVHGCGQNPGNTQRRFHATTLKCNFSGATCTDRTCLVCCIINEGFKLELNTRAGFGKGLYSTSRSSTAWAYVKQKSVQGKQAMFMVSVACGTADMANNAGPLPPGTHSRIVKLATGDDECVVFNNDAMVARWLLIF
eukprot:1659634-Amphidinium_carterae.1